MFYAIQIVVISLAIPAVACFFGGPFFEDLASGNASNLILSIMCCGSLVIGLVLALLSVIFGLLWETSGVETVEITSSSLQRRLAPAPLWRAKKQYNMIDVEGIRAEYHELAEYKPFRQIDTWGYVVGRLPGQIAFDYRGATRSFGNGLSAADAEHLADLIATKLGPASPGGEC